MPLVRYKPASRSISARLRRPTTPDSSLINRVHHKSSAANRWFPQTLTLLPSSSAISPDRCGPGPSSAIALRYFFSVGVRRSKRTMNGLPRLYAKYVGHDDNRDFYMSNMKESTNMNHRSEEHTSELQSLRH